MPKRPSATAVRNLWHSACGHASESLTLLHPFPMDPATPVNVAKGAIATCEFVLSAVLLLAETLTTFSLTAVAAGTLTAIRALLKGSHHPTPLALSASVNGGIAGAVFFSAFTIF